MKFLFNALLIYLAFAFLSVAALAGGFMLFSKKITVYPFSGFDGQLLHEGKPAAFAEVTRTYNWDGTLHKETVKADAEGRFAFESVSAEMRQGIAQFSSSQKVYVSYEGKESLIWACGKIAKEEYGEFGGRPKNMLCEITSEIQSLRLPNGIAGASCYWEVLEDDEKITPYNLKFKEENLL